ncbi:MAG: cobalamin-dependent protein [Victivallaceae bacterium]|nr:cobalamin-dependent protein [Victivallaceae bacterium]
MNILLISTNTCNDPYVVYPLGMSVVTRVLLKAGHSIKQFDLLVTPEANALDKVVNEFSPELIGISIRNVDSVNSMRENDHFIDNVTRVIKQLSTLTSAEVFLGGPGFSLIPEAILAATGANYGIAGEGEQAVLALIEKITAGQAVKQSISRGRIHIPGGAFYDPALVKFYNNETHMIPVQTKRGCSFNCVYCSYPQLEGPCFRPRDYEQVIDDISYLQNECGVELIYFVDSVFNDPDGNYLELLQLMRSRKIKIPWVGFISPYKLTGDDVELMVETGFCWADVGGDGATDTTLKALGKQFSFDDIYNVCALLREHKVSVSNSFMFGGPSETEATVHEGIANILSMDWVTSTVFPGIRIIPGTPLEKIAVKRGIIQQGQSLLDAVYYIEPGLTKAWLETTLTAGFAGAKCCIFPPHAKNEQLQMIHKIGFKKFRSLM